MEPETTESDSESIFPAFAREWAARRCSEHPTPVSDSDVLAVASWLASLPKETPRMVPKLPRLTWKQALAASGRRTELLGRRKARLAVFGGSPDDAVTVSYGEPGYRWVRITTADGLRFEGSAMGHCVGRGDYVDECVYSLRDRSNAPHCTVSFDVAERVVGQVRGRGNGHVHARHRASVRRFVDGLSPTRVADAPRFGHVFVARGCGTPSLMPFEEFSGLEDPVVSGDLYLDGCVGLTALPEGLSVRGETFLHRCPDIRTFPDRMGMLHGGLRIVGCAGLVSLTEGLRIGRMLRLADCPVLAALPSGIRVGGDLVVSGCPALTSFPSVIAVGGDVDIEGKPGLPDGTRRMPPPRILRSDFGGFVEVA